MWWRMPKPDAKEDRENPDELHAKHTCQPVPAVIDPLEVK
jgi:hypothetical protein